MNSKFFSLIGALSVVVLLPACWSMKKETDVVPAAGLHVVNVLDAEYYNDAHIPGSINVPMGQIKDFIVKTNKNDEVVVYCANYKCSASSSVAKELIDAGFARVFAYEAGTAEWFQKGLPLRGNATQAYLKGTNTPGKHEIEVPLITTEQLYDKMVTAGLISPRVKTSIDVEIATSDQPTSLSMTVKE